MTEAFLRQVAIFEQVDDASLAALAAGAEAKELVASTVVFQAGDLCDGLYLVRRGVVALRHLAVGQPIERVRDHGPGEPFGESEVLDGTRRQFQARTVGAASLVRLPQEPFWSFLDHHPQVERRLRTLAIYQRTVRLHSLLAPSTRRDPRIRVDREARLRLGAGPAALVRVEDLSHGGACLSAAPDTWRPGDLVRFALELDGHPDLLEVEARVRWRMRDLVGLVFEGGASARKVPRQVDRALRVLLDKPSRF